MALDDPARHVLIARARDDHGAFGYIDVLDEHPDDGCPWLEVVEIHADAQRRRLGRQCVEAIARRAHDDLGAGVLRAAMDTDDDLAQTFLRSLRFLPVDTRERSSPQGRVGVVVYETPLVPESTWL